MAERGPCGCCIITPAPSDRQTARGMLAIWFVINALYAWLAIYCMHYTF